MKNSPDLFLLSAISYKLFDMLTADEAALLAASLTALGDMLAVLLARNDI